MEKLKEKLSGRDWSKSLAVAAGALLVGLLAAYFAQGEALKRSNARINAVYQKAFYETCELMEGMAGNFRKLLVASGAQETELLGEIARQAEGAQNNLAALPLGGDLVSGSIKFVNQAGDFAAALSTRLAGGGAVSESDYETMSALSASAGEFSAGLSQLLNRYEEGETVFTSEDFDPTGAEDLYPLNNPASEYPVLLYDGPFSDGRADEQMRALDGLREVSAEEAMQLLTAFAGAEGVSGLALDGESTIPVDCYDFSFVSNGYPMSASVTKQGGRVLYMLTSESVTEQNFLDEQAIEAAELFLRSRGFGQMEMSYYSRFEGILTVNFASVQSGVILYPDLVKVQISLRDGTVVGLEAANYLNNHVQRELSLPQLSQEEALAHLNPRLEAERVRLCVIPENSSEYLCYEIMASQGTETFLVYVDANTGAVRSIMQLISDENGALVM